MIAAVAHGPSPLWYATRGAGAVTLVCLTLAVALGITETRALRPPGMPRFAVAWLHRSVSLLALALLAVHVATVLLDPFPHFGITAVVVPFSASYRPLWIGLGALAFDLLIAVVLTSLVRARLGYRAWRGVHWAAYACWPVALLHGLGAGSDDHARWMLALTGGCVAAVVAAVGVRLAAPGTRPAVRLVAPSAMLLGLVGLVAWAQQGPLASGWARRAGTPPSVVAAFAPPAAGAHAHGRSARRHPATTAPRPFSGRLSGVVRSGLVTDGTAVVDLRMRVGGAGPARLLRVRIDGQPLEGGGVSMARSAVSYGPASRPGEFQGRVQQLQDNRLEALVGARDGRALRLRIALSLDGGVVHGDVSGTPVT